jgi:hypothetical protein
VPSAFYISFYVMRVNFCSLPYDTLFITNHGLVSHDLHVSIPPNTFRTNGWIFAALRMYVRPVITGQRACIQKKTLITNKCTKRVLSSIVTHSLRSRLASTDRREFTPPKTTQYTVNSTFSFNYKVQP